MRVGVPSNKPAKTLELKNIKIINDKIKVKLNKKSLIFFEIWF